jgi:hypothetical protein
MTVRILALLGLGFAAAAAAGQGIAPAPPPSKFAYQYSVTDEKKATNHALEFLDLWKWVWRVGIFAGVNAGIGAVFARRIIRARAIGDFTTDPWVRAKLEGGRLPGTLTRIEENEERVAG